MHLPTTLLAFVLSCALCHPDAPLIDAASDQSPPPTTFLPRPSNYGPLGPLSAAPLSPFRPSNPANHDQTITETVYPVPYTRRPRASARAQPSTPSSLPSPSPSLNPSTPSTLSSTGLGAAIILSTCPYPLYLFSSSPFRTSAPYPLTPSPLGSYNETFQDPHDPAGGGMSLKIARSADPAVLYDGVTPLLQLQYTLDEAAGQVWYALVQTRGDVMRGDRVGLGSGGCGGVSWGGGEGEGRRGDEVSGVMVCGSGGDLVLRLC